MFGSIFSLIYEMIFGIILQFLSTLGLSLTG